MKELQKKIIPSKKANRSNRSQFSTNLILNRILSSLRNGNNLPAETIKENRENRQNYWAKWIDPVVIVTIVLAVATFMLYREATRQSRISKQAADAATVAADQSIKAYDLAKIESDSSNSMNARNYELQRKSVNTQIQSIISARNEVNIENRPYVQLENMQLDSSGKIEKKIHFTANITDLGKFPAKIISFKTVVGTQSGDSIKSFTILLDRQTAVIQNHTVFNNTVLPINMYSKGGIAASEVTELSLGKRFFYVLGEIKYESFVSKDTYYNRFMYKIQVEPYYNVTAIMNKDSVIHKK